MGNIRRCWHILRVANPLRGRRLYLAFSKQKGDKESSMNKIKHIFLFILVIIIQSNLNADFITELAKRDSKNPINITDSSCILYAKNGYFYTEYRNDGYDSSSIVAYKIQEDSIKLIVRNKTWDFAFRVFDYFYLRDQTDEFTVNVHDYYLIEIVYVNDKLETYCNRIKNINTNGFIYNEAKISGNIKEGSDHYPTFPYLDTKLTEGMKVKIVALTNNRTNSMAENSYAFKTYDYYYNILVEDKQVRINGYLLDFNNYFDYRSILLILKSGNTPQAMPLEEARDYFGTWRYIGTGGMGFEEYKRIITITISADKFHYHFKGHTIEHEYTLINPTWTSIIRPDEDFKRNVEIWDDSYKEASGYLITGTLTNKTGNWSPETETITEYVYLSPDNKNFIFWYNFYITNYVLRRIN